MIDPEFYHIVLEPDFNDWTVKTTTTIIADIDSDDKEIILNQNGLNVKSIRLDILTPSIIAVLDEEGYIIDNFSADDGKQLLHIPLPNDLREKADDIDTLKVSLKIESIAKITDDLLGLYRSHYYEGNEKKYILVTQFEEREARKVFPCLDDPAFKARFRINFIIPKDLTGISNMPIESEQDAGNGKKLVEFEKTPPMCTYILFFGIGDFEFKENNSEQTPLIRIAAPPGRVQYGDFALEVAEKCLKDLEDYTGVEYPLPKLDHIAVQDFAFGAMENWGAVTYRENLLLVFPGKTTKEGISQIATTIIHETSHMWFGNLVSPKSWKYIWLNESFASFFTYHITNRLFPKWDIWSNFIIDYTIGAFSRDSYRDSPPIELRGLEEVWIDSSTAPIIYNKGASVLRMLIKAVGENIFKMAVNHYLKQYAYMSISTEEFWHSYDDALKNYVKNEGNGFLSEFSAEKFAESWVFHPGYPIIECEEDSSGESVLLKQRRFTYLPAEKSRSQWDGEKSNPEDGHLWYIPLKITYYKIKNKETEHVSPEDVEKESKTLLFDGQSLKIEMPEWADAYKLNENWEGFYRVKYPEANYSVLGKLIKNKILGPIERIQILNDRFALMLRGDINYGEFIEFLVSNYTEENEFAPLMEICGDLGFIFRILPIPKAIKDKVAGFMDKILDINMERLGFEPKDGESIHDSIIRGELLNKGAILGGKWAEKIREWTDEKFKGIKENKRINPDILRPVLINAARTRNDVKEIIMQWYSNPETTQAEKIQLHYAMAYLGDKNDLEEIIAYILEKLPYNNKWMPITLMGDNPAAEGLLWDWFRRNIKDVKKLFQPSYFGRMLKSILVCSPKDDKGFEEVHDFFDTNKEIFTGMESLVRMGLEFYDMLHHFYVNSTNT